MILSGELAVGEQLPPARELSVKMGVSRPVISAGLVELEKLGFYRTLLNRDAETAEEKVHSIMQDALDNLSIYGA